MPTVAENWDPIASTLGYKNSKDMLIDLYVNQHFSIEDLAKRLGYSKNNLRRRLLMLGIQLRSRGGKNNLGKNVLKDVPDAEFQHPREVANKYNVHISTVFSEKRRRGLQSCDLSQSSPPPILNDSAEGETNTSCLPMNSSEEVSTPTSTSVGGEKEISSSSTTAPTKES